jgi:outer membrane protein, multidrug efflux system
MNHRAIETLTAALVATALLALCLVGCNVGPNYVRPAAETPATFRGAAPESPASSASLADERWWEVFADQHLVYLIRSAVSQNYDVRIAAARVLEAEAQLGVTRSAQLPTVGAQLSVQGDRRLPDRAQSSSTDYFVGVSAAWEVDFWGKFRRASEAARADMLASEWGRRASIQTLVGQVATAYFVLRALDRQLDIAERAAAARRQSLHLTERREQSGQSSLLDVHQARELVELAEGERIDLSRRIEQQENLISTLSGRDPGPVARGLAVTEQRLPSELPAGLPSELLERRPDVQVAEQGLVSANAQVGVAKAELFPQLTLTGSGGLASGALLSLFTSPVALLNAAGSLVQPIFNGGRLRGEVLAADARMQQAALVYRRTILQALREVSDSLVGCHRNRELFTSREELLHSASQARALVEMRYQNGTSSYLEVLDGDTRLLGAEFSLVDAQLGVLLSYVELYRALGGGWQV